MSPKEVEEYIEKGEDTVLEELKNNQHYGLITDTVESLSWWACFEEVVEDKVIDYIIALTNLYGLVHKEKVIEIYNIQNDINTNVDIINSIMKGLPEALRSNFIKIHGDYFVTDSILEFDQFNEQLSQRAGKPFYIPAKEELLKYRDERYFEVNREYKKLLNYLNKNIFYGDKYNAEMLCEDIQGICRYAFSIQKVLDEFNRRDISFNGEEQVNEVMKMIMNLANNTRIWENNGHTPQEIFELMGKQSLRSLPDDDARVNASISNEKVGRNDKCPCGSGKKYKKCCLGK